MNVKHFLSALASVGLVFLFLILFGDCAFAQQFPGFDPNNPGGGGPPCAAGPCIPIDGGISGLIALGLAWGGKKLYDQSKS